MYKRLTEYDGHVAVTKGRHIDVSMLIDRLAAYEDTGLTPEQIDRLKIICKKHFTEEEHYASIEELAEVEQITEGAIYGIPRK